ncbi:OmpA family protein [Pendulispora rubella]|uniref:OmpA family protein n=1 Tax=Pendulispora rubella TaxID=2741070 RepID=A0ABZ2KT68_9BACT
MNTRFVLPVVGLSLFSLVALAAVGCAHEPVAPAVAAPAARPPAPVASAPPPPAAPYHGAAVAISGDLLAACNIVLGKVDAAPKFDFDDSALPDQDRGVLDQVAKCVTTGPLRGRSLALVGRADPRGEVEYNFVLGEHRADSVANYLGQLGVAKDKLRETSRGKLDAIGTDDESWARDRRVDIALL